MVIQDLVYPVFKRIRENIINGFQSLEAEHSDCVFVRKSWEHLEGSGGGQMGVLHGQLLEKAGVNISMVCGTLSQDIPGLSDAKVGQAYQACGVSVIVHPMSPFLPSSHMNVRCMRTTHNWFGGCADLTPTFFFEDDNADFHSSLQKACDDFCPDKYPAFKKQCDEYFYLPHRQEPRGIGGIFFDNYNSGSTENDLAFCQSVAEQFLTSYTRILRRRMDKQWTDEDKHKQLVKRGRYVEFNLLHDKGTAFGLKTNGNIEAILVSLPPMVAWP